MMLIKFSQMILIITFVLSDCNLCIIWQLR